MRRVARPSFVMPDDEINFKDYKRLAVRMHIARLNQRQALLAILAARRAHSTSSAPSVRTSAPRPPTPEVPDRHPGAHALASSCGPIQTLKS